MKKFLVSLLTIIIFISVVSILKNNVFAYDYSGGLKNLDSVTATESGIEEKTKSIASVIIDTIQIVGTGISIIILIFMGIQYMLKSPSEKADFKKSMVAYIVGAVILFTATNIVKIIADFATKNTVST